jgi:hypothetical protein
VPPKARFALVAELADEGVPVKQACIALGVSRSGFSDSRDRPPSARAIRQAWLIDQITAVHEASGRPMALRGSTPSSSTAKARRVAQDRRGVDAPCRPGRAAAAPPGQERAVGDDGDQAGQTGLPAAPTSPGLGTRPTYSANRALPTMSGTTLRAHVDTPSVRSTCETPTSTARHTSLGGDGGVVFAEVRWCGPCFGPRARGRGRCR